MVKQTAVDITAPTDINVPATIGGSKLTPELATVAINLHIDYYRQIQSIVNRHLFWNYKTMFVWTTVIASYSWWKTSDVFLYNPNIFNNGFFKYEFSGILVFVAMFTATIFLGIAKLTESVRDYSDSLIDNSEVIFGFDIKKFAKLNKQNKQDLKKIQSLGANSELIVYRNVPIAVATLQVDSESSNDEELVVKITGLAVKKVYVKSGLSADLFDWAVFRSKKLLADEETGKAKSVKLGVEIYSVDKFTKRILTQKEFTLEKKVQLPGLLGSLFDVSKETWILYASSESDVPVENSKNVPASTSVSSSKNS